MNMRVELQNDQSGDKFSKQLIDIGYGKLPIDMLTGCINFPQSFCELRIYTSVDSATNQDYVVNCPPEFLNSLDLPGLPPHNLQLKVGSVVIMLRNINQQRLCNGAPLAIKKLLNNVIEATILKGKYRGDVLIPRIPMIPTDVPFELK
ncbi:unnamed protein product [Psylliodes chrysocephalus]|uniref:DNA helicase Pif1-like 2B domain-containing protein n=1 Tax=Psylliodes chrysocephalus TaxID=3402493 RepID=A0A9P0CXT7_9CUCU|nr:unnamed protein product [Psylliodes chrysocephala]